MSAALPITKIAKTLEVTSNNGGKTFTVTNKSSPAAAVVGPQKNPTPMTRPAPIPLTGSVEPLMGPVKPPPSPAETLAAANASLASLKGPNIIQSPLDGGRRKTRRRNSKKTHRRNSKKTRRHRSKKARTHRRKRV